jgi:signal transduction histidine kinase/AraC-like DNA-binding protein
MGSPLKKVVNETAKIKLGHDQNMFTIDYFGLGYTRSKNIEYAYYLEGFETDWNYVKKIRNATYTNIPAGDYNFKVKAVNSDGIWNETPTVLGIKILVPWWKTNVALLIFLLLTLTVVYVIYKFLKVRLVERQQIKNEREERAQDEALNAKKIQFFTNISHEFRTPLTLILNPLEAIIGNKTVELPSDIEEKHTIIYKNSKRLSRLIDELMDFRKLQFNKMSINASKFDIVSFVNEVASHFEEEAGERNIILSVDSPQENISIWADPSMLEKIIFNLLSNAFKATKDNGMVSIKIQVPLKPIDFPLLNNEEEQYGIEIIIQDSGIGIDKKDLEHIFTRFYQSNEMDKQYYGGTGIGLEVVKSFIDLHMGLIEVRSEQKKGTEFKIKLPLGSKHLNLSKSNFNSKTNDEIYEQINNSEVDEEISSVKVNNRKTVLIVEDNSELRNYLKNELKDDYKVRMAINGKEGLQMAIKFIPDIIISDVMMPIMDGFEMCSNIKKDLRISHIPVLMLTAKGMQIDRVKGIDSGADVYLNKPFNMNVLKSHLSQLINSRQILFNKYYNGVSDKELMNTNSLDKQFITNILEYINQNINDPALNVENLADELLISRSKLYRKIKVLTGNTANEFIKKIRLEKAKQFLESTDYSISEISFKVGFSSPSYFTKCYKTLFGRLPTEVRGRDN